MGEWRSHVGDDRCNTWKERRPADVGRRSDQNFAWVELIAFLCAVQATHQPLDTASISGKAGDGVRIGDGDWCM